MSRANTKEEAAKIMQALACDRPLEKRVLDAGNGFAHWAGASSDEWPDFGRYEYRIKLVAYAVRGDTNRSVFGWRVDAERRCNELHRPLSDVVELVEKS